MRVWTASPEEFKHVRAIMMCAVYFGGRRAKLQLKSGKLLAGVIVSTNFGTDLPDIQTVLHGEDTLSAGRMFGELHILPDVGPIMVVRAIEIETIEPAELRSERSTKA
jgi:hypothetical protein